MKHSRFSPSGAETWFNCPGSVEAQDGLPKYDYEEYYTREGTVAHAVCERSLKNNSSANKLIGEVIDGIEIGAEMAAHCNKYVEIVLSHLNENCLLLVERRLSYESHVIGGFGTPDAIVLDNETGICHVFDFKYGEGLRIDAFKNKQTMIYALGVLHDIPESWAIESFRIHMVQPRIEGAITEWDLSIAELLEFGEIVREKAKQTGEKGAKKVAGFKQCQWCEAKAYCGTLESAVRISELDDHDAVTIKLMGWDAMIDEISLDRRKEILAGVSLRHKLDEAIKLRGINELTSGKKLPGLKAVNRYSRRKWSEHAEKELLKISAEIYDLMTPAAAEILMREKTGRTAKLCKSEINKLTFKSEIGLALVPESDKRPDALEIRDGFNDETTGE